MTQERRQDERRRQRLAKQQQRRQGRPQRTDAPVSGVEFGGVMGWMQRSARWWFLGAIVVFVASLGAGQFLAGGTPVATPTPLPTAEASETPTGTPTASATPTPSPTPTPDPSIQRLYDAAPPMAIDVTKHYTAVLTLAKGGEVEIELLPEAAPAAVNSFVFLAGRRFFDGLTFHRVLPGFVAQGGDPEGNGFGGPGYTLPPDKNTLKFDAGVIAMAKSSAGVSGSQFFITLAPTPTLQTDFAVFGRVTKGMDVVQAITPRTPDSSKPNQPAGDIIASIKIIEGN